MKFKLNKKTLTTVGLSCLLLFPLVLTSCGNSEPPVEKFTEFELGNQQFSIYPPPVDIELDGSINEVYKKYGDEIYYQDHNNLWTLDLSKFHNVVGIRAFAFGLFEKEINRLILPKNSKIDIDPAAFYPNTKAGHESAKRGINPMFKTIAKSSPKYNADKYYFELDVTDSWFHHPKLIQKNPPKKIFPINDFEYNFIDEKGIFNTPPFL